MKHTETENLNLYASLLNHLHYNHVPSIPPAFISACIEAIEACDDEDYERLIETPYPHKRYGNECPAWVIIEFAHLDGYLQDHEEYSAEEEEEE